jgi:hypothetical protein
LTQNPQKAQEHEDGEGRNLWLIEVYNELVIRFRVWESIYSGVGADKDQNGWPWSWLACKLIG